MIDQPHLSSKPHLLPARSAACLTDRWREEALHGGGGGGGGRGGGRRGLGIEVEQVPDRGRGGGRGLLCTARSLQGATGARGLRGRDGGLGE